MSSAKICFRDKYADNEGLSPLYLVIHMAGKKIRFCTGVQIKRELWNHQDQVIIGRSKEIRDKNLILNECLARINDILVKYRLQHRNITPDILKYEYDHYSASIDFIAFMEEQIKERRGELAASTIRQHIVCLNKLKSFQKEIIFSEINEVLVQRFKAHLRDHYKNDLYTISSNLKVFKVYIRRAIKKRIINDNPFEFIHLVKPSNERTFLVESEIAKMVELYNKNFLPKTHQKVLRHFLFAIFTGLRISDVKAITMENVVRDTLIFTPFKTKNTKAAVVRIPIQSLAARMIKDESPNRLNGPVFAMLSEFRTNKYLKEIAGHLSLEKNISFHTARHSFATYFLRKTKNLLALQKLLGHSNIRETMIYSHILMEDIEAEMKCFETFA